MKNIVILVFLVGFIVNCTIANAIPASVLRCVNNFAYECPGRHKDFYCICGKRQDFLKCLADFSAYGNFLEARDHFLGTCIEHIPDLSKHPDFNLDLPNDAGYTSLPSFSSAWLLKSVISIKATAKSGSKPLFTTSTTKISTAYIYSGQSCLSISASHNSQNPTMSILPIKEPIRNKQPDSTSLPFLPPLGPLSPPFYDIGGDCENECRCDESDLDCIEYKDIENCIYKCISKKYNDRYDGEGDGSDDVDGNDDCDEDYDQYCDNDYDDDYNDNYNYDYNYNYNTGYEYKYDECKSDVYQNDCLYDDGNIVTDYFKYKQAILSLPRTDQQNSNINEESAKFWSEERKARDDIAKELLRNEHSFQQVGSDLKYKNNEGKNATGNEGKRDSAENVKKFQNPLHDEIKEEIMETKNGSSQKKNLALNAVEFKFATPEIMFGKQDSVIRQNLLESEKPKANKDLFLLQSYSKRRNGEAYNKKKYRRKTSLNKNLSREGTVRFESPHLDSSKILKEQRIKINKTK